MIYIHFICIIFYFSKHKGYAQQLKLTNMASALAFVGAVFSVLLFSLFFWVALQHPTHLEDFRHWSKTVRAVGWKPLALRQSLTPFSPVCRQFSYERYFRAYDFSQMRKFGKKAVPGDMIELMPGIHKPFYSTREKTDGEGLCGEWPRRLKSATAFKLHGTPEKMITFCGSPHDTVIDGTRNLNTGAGLEVAQSSYVRFAGFSIKNVLRAVDVQDTVHSEILYITSTNTWHEGMRIRYNSSHNTVAFSKIMHTGKGYPGNGEGIYVGTASGRTVDCGNPSDQTNYNTIAHNSFGPMVPSENIDVKEFTVGGRIVNNTFNGAGLKGIHASTSWVALKGKEWLVANNTGFSLAVRGAGIRVLKRAPTYGSSNLFLNNTCYDISEDSFCIFVDPQTKNNSLGCGDNKNSLKSSAVTSSLTNQPRLNIC